MMFHELKKIKDEVGTLWIKNHNINATFTSIELLIGILVCVVLLFLTMIFLVFNK
jgi:competence protein ComGC